MRAQLVLFRLLTICTLAGLLLSSTPPLATPRALAQPRPAAPTAAALAAPAGAGPAAPLAAPLLVLPKPSGAGGSTGLPASAVSQLRALYGARQTLNGVFDGQFNTEGRLVTTIPGPYAFFIADGYSPTLSTTLTLPAAIYQSVDLDVGISGTGAAAKLAVRPDGSSTWSEITVLDGVGAPTTRHVTLGWALPSPPTKVQVRLACAATGFNTGTCTFSNLRFMLDTPGWLFTAVSSDLPMPTMDASARVYAQAYQGITPLDGPFLGIETFHVSGGAGANATQRFLGPLMQLPATGTITMSVQWARSPTIPPSGDPIGSATLSFDPLDGTTGVDLNLDSANVTVPWTRVVSAPLPAGKVGRLRLTFNQSWTPRIMGFDSITIYQNGKPVSIPADQVVGKCNCAAGGRDQAHVNDPVNSFSGAFYLRPPADVALASAGPPLSFARTYVSLFANPAAYPTTALGPGWRHSFGSALTVPGQTGSETGTLIYEAPTGNRLRFYDPTTNGTADAMLDAAPGVHATLVRASGSYTLTLRDQSIERFDSLGRLTERRDPAGHSQTLAYYSGTGQVWDGQLAVVTDTVTLRRLTLTYTSVGGQARLQAVTQAPGQAVAFSYTTSGDLATVTDLRGGVTTYGYDGATHHLTTIQNPANVTLVTTTYDSNTPRRVSQQVDATGLTTTYAYDPAAAGGPTTTITRQRAGQPSDVQKDHYRQDGSLEYQEHNGLLLDYMTFDGSLTPNTVVDGNGRATLLQNDGVGLPSAMTDASGRTSTVTYRADARPTQLVGADGITTTATYDSAGNLTQATSTGASLTRTSSYTYTTDNRIQEQRGPDGLRTRWRYDALGQVISSTVGFGTPLGQTSTYAYDSFGRVVTTTVGVGTALARVDITRYNADHTVERTIQNYKPGVTQPDANVTTLYRYDLLGRLVAATDPLGHTAATHYNAAGQVDWTARNLSPAQFDSNGLPVFKPFTPATPDANVATRYGYDSLGRTSLVSQTGVLTGTFNTATLQFTQVYTPVMRTQYDTLSRPVTVTLDYGGANLQTLTNYDGAGNVIWQRDTFGRWTRQDYDSLNRPVTTTLNYENGDPLTIAVGNQSWASAIDNDTDRKTVTRYDSRGRVDQQIDNYVNGVFVSTEAITDRITLYQYDPLNRLTTTIRNQATGLTGSEYNQTSTTAYNAVTGRVDGTRDPLNRWSSQQYDALGQVIKTTQNCTGGGAPQSCGSQTADTNVSTRMLYDTLGRTSLITDALGIVTQSIYDGMGRTTKTVQNYVKNGPTTTVTNVTMLMRYDALGRTTILTDALGYPTRTTYDGLGQTIIVTDTMGRATRMGYDGRGILRWSKLPTGQVTVYEVDSLGRVTATILNYVNGQRDATDPVDQDLISRMVYDEGGRRVQQSQRADPADQVTLYAYDKLDRLSSVTEHAVTGTCTNQPCNVLTRYRYDRAGNRIALVDANSHIRRFSYDAADQQKQAIDALNHTTIYTYNQVGQLTQQQDPRGATNKLTFGYDGLNRLNSTAATNLGAITRAYDQLGRTKVLTDSSGTTSFSYDSLSRMTKVTAPNTGSVTYGYSARGERSQVGYPNSGPTVQYAYGLDGQLRVVTDTIALASYAYDGAGRLRQVTRANNQVTNDNYDQAERLIESSTAVSGTLVGRFQYGLNRLGLRTVVTETLPLTPTLSTSWMETGSFEAGSLTDPTSGVDQVVGTVQLETAAPIKGAFSARVPNTSTSYLREDISSVDELFVSFYLRITALPSSNTRIFQIDNSGTTVANFQLTTSGRLRLRNGSTSLGLDSAPLTVGAVYRVGLHQKKGTGANGVLEAYLAGGDAPFTSAFSASSSESFTTAATRVNLGASTGTAANIVVDEFRLDRGTSVPPPPPLLAARATATTAAEASTAAPASLTPPADALLPPAPDATSARAAFSRLPLTFIPNTGQTDARARFLLRGMGGTLFFTPGELAMALRPPTRPRQRAQSATPQVAANQAPPRDRERPRQEVPRAVLRQGYLGSNGAATMAGALRLPGRANFLTGGDPSKWRTDLPTYAGMIYRQIYTGIDLHYSGTEGQLKTTYVVAPGADPTRIQWRYNGAQDVRVDTAGNLVVTVPPPPADLITDTEMLSSTLIEQAPIAWQTINEREVAVPVRYSVDMSGTVSFALGAYDHTQRLVIDPTLVYSALLSGGGDDSGHDIALDSAGNAYIVGTTDSSNFPTTVGGRQPTYAGGDSDIFVAKLNPGGSALVYATYLGGTNTDLGNSIAIDSSGSAYVTGATLSTNIIVTGSAYRANKAGGWDAFVTKLSATGSSLGYSTYLGGISNETGNSIALDSSNNAYVVGFTDSITFPTTLGAYRTTLLGGGDAFVTKLNATGSALSYSTFLGATDGANDVVVDSSGSAYVTGTATAGLPTTGGVQQTNYGGGSDAFVTKLNASGSAALYSTYLGGSDDEFGLGIALDSAGNAYVTGYTWGSDFPTTSPQQPASGGSSDAFVTKLNSTASARLYSSYLGGSGDDVGQDIALDGAGNIFIAGQTTSTNFPAAAPPQPAQAMLDGFVSLLRVNGYGVAYSLVLSGDDDDRAYAVAVDRQGNAIVTGETFSTNFLTVGGLGSNLNNADAFVTKVNASVRVTTYTYDGLLRLIGVVESPGSTYAYTDDLAGNRTSVQVNGGTPTTLSYNAADQIAGPDWIYDVAGNLVSDPTTAYTYDALNRLVEVDAPTTVTTNIYNGDGALIKQVANSTTTYDTQDLAAPLSQILQTKQGATTTSFLYGLERLAVKNGATRTWYLADALGSVRRTLSDSGAATTPVFYDPWGTVESGVVPTFGFTGELQDTAAGLVNLRARWYSTARGTFTSRDSFPGFPEQPYSMHSYQYAYSDPVLLTDAAGRYAVDDSGRRESRRCPPGTTADPRTGRCGGSGSRSSGSWGGGGGGSGWEGNAWAPGEKVCGPRPEEDPIFGTFTTCNERTRAWEPIQSGTIVIPGMSNVVQGIGAVCAAALGYLMGKAITDQIKGAGGSTYTSDTSGDTAGPGGLDPNDPNSEEVDHLKHIFQQRFGSKPGADQVLRELDIAGNRARGANWQVRYALERLNPNDVVGFERAGTTGRVDIVLQQGNRITFLEAKQINWYALEKLGVTGEKAESIVRQVLGQAAGQNAFSKVVIEATGRIPDWFVDLLEQEGISVEVFPK